MTACTACDDTTTVRSALNDPKTCPHCQVQRSISPDVRQYILELPSGEQIDVNVECDEVSWREYDGDRWYLAQDVPECVTVVRTP